MAKYQCDKGHVFLFPATQHMGSEFTWVESKECPRCQSEAISEFVEPEADITSVLSCDLGAVDGFLKQGYIVKELYAKTATLIKKESPQQSEDKFTEDAKTYYAKLHGDASTAEANLT